MSPFCVIVRHGNTFDAGEPPRRIGAATDLPLTETGRAQALRLGDHFAARGWRFARVLTSPLVRTRETAELILSRQEQPATAQMCPWLAEIDHGPDENRTEAEVVARIGEAALADWDAHGIAPPGWTIDAEARQLAWRDFFARRADGPALLVTSNGAGRLGLLAEPGLAAQAAALPSLKLATGAYGVIALAPVGPRLAAWNQRP